MEKAQFHSLVVLQVKVIYCLLAAAGLSVIAVLDLLEDKKVFAAIAAGFSLMLVLYAGYLLLRRKKRSSPYPEWLLVGLLSIFTLFGMNESSQVVHWIYFVPIYTYFLFPFRVASYIALIYSLALVALVLDNFDSYLRLQMLFTYAACYTFSVMYALINERNNQGLTEIVNTDPLTQVYNEHQLYLDLNKEMTRADRQRSQLVVLAVATPSAWHQLKVEDYEQRLSYLGKRLRKSLRNYDACYRLNTDDFIILMPHSDPADAEELQQIINDSMQSSRYDTLNKLKMQQEEYRADDDGQSLIERVMENLHAH